MCLRNTCCRVADLLLRANIAAAAAAGSLADRYGGKFVLTTGVFLWSLFTVLTPSAAAAGTVPLLAARVLLGIGEGVAFPSIHSMIGKHACKPLWWCKQQLQ
jgi:MFS family permease